MYGFRKLTVLFTSLIAVLFSNTLYASWFTNQEFYYGGGVGYEIFNFKPGYGDGFMPTDSVAYDLYLGTEHPTKIGFEFGTEFTPNRSKTSGLQAGDHFPGTTVPLSPGTWEVWEPSFNSVSIYIGLNKFFVIPNYCKWQAFGFLGLSATYVRAVANFISDDLPVPPSPLEITLARNTFEDTKIIPMIKLGLEYNFHRYFAAKMYYIWKNTAAFNNLKSWEYPESDSEMRMKGMHAFYLGLNLYL